MGSSPRTWCSGSSFGLGLEGLRAVGGLGVVAVGPPIAVGVEEVLGEGFGLARCGQPFLAPDAIRVARAWSSTLCFPGAAMLLILPWDQSLHQTRGESG